MKNTHFNAPIACKRLLLAGLLLLPLAARATEITAFSASNQTISVNGTVDTWSTGYFYVGNGFNTDTLAISNGGTLTTPSASQYVLMGNVVGNINNAITIDGVGSRFNITNGGLSIGVNSPGNSLTVSNGGTMTGGSWGTTMGSNGGGYNSAVITGAGSTWTPSNLNLNAGGSNSVSALAGGVINDGGTMFIGNYSGSNTVTVSGTNSLLRVDGVMTIGTTNILVHSNALLVGTGGTVNVRDFSNTGAGIILTGLSGATGNKVQIDGGTLNVSSATNTNAIDIRKGALILNSGTVTTERLLANTDATSVVTFNGGTLNTQGTTVANGAVFTVGNGTSAATLKLNGGSHSFANGIALAANSTLSGTGTVTAGALAVASGATLSPGNSPGTLTLGATTLEGGGNYNWQMLNATSAAGTGYDTINLTTGAALTLNNTSGNKFNINLWSLTSILPDVNGNAANFNNALSQSWTLFATDQAISGFSANKFAVNVAANDGTGGFSNGLAGGSFGVALADGGTDLVLTFTAVPEPGAWLLGAIGLTVVSLRRRRVA